MTYNDYLKNYLFQNETQYRYIKGNFKNIHKTEEVCYCCFGKGTKRIATSYYDYDYVTCPKCKGNGFLTKQYYKEQFALFCKEERRKKDEKQKKEKRIIESINTFLSEDDVIYWSKNYDILKKKFRKIKKL